MAQQQFEKENNWSNWSMFIIKSIERIETLLKECNQRIDNMVERFNDSILKIRIDIENKIDSKIKELEVKYDERIAKLEEKDDCITNDLTKNKVKLTFIISILTILVSAIISGLFNMLIK